MLPAILSLDGLRSIYLDRPAAVIDVVEEVLARIASAKDPAIFISLVAPADLRRAARELLQREPDPALLPLWGIPFAVKDNIDVAGLDTTAACPAFAYRANNDATTVARLKAAGALVVGKTNLDQFATGLNGTRSPYGAPRSVFNVGLCLGRIEFGLGDRGRRRSCALCARHRHGGLCTGAGCVQQYRGNQTNTWSFEFGGGCSGLLES